MGRRYQHYLDPGGLAVPRRDLGPPFPARRGMGREQLHEAGSGDPGIEDGHRVSVTATRLHPPYGSRQPILLPRLSEDPAPARLQGVHERQGKLLRVSALRRRSEQCRANAAVETFFKTIKAELVWRQSWETRRHAEMAIFQYINGFYNPRRRHSTLGWKSPVAFERKVA